MSKLLTALLAAAFTVVTVTPVAFAAKHEMKKEEAKMEKKADEKKKAEPKKKGEGKKKSEGKKGEAKKAEEKK